MSEISPLPQVTGNWAHLSTNMGADICRTLTSLLHTFSPQELGNAVTAQSLLKFVDGLREQINSSELPQGIKERALAILDKYESSIKDACPCSQQATDAVANSAESDAINESAAAAAEAAAEAANECAATPGVANMENNRPVNFPACPGSKDDSMDEINQQQANQTDADKRKGNWLEVLAMSLADIQNKFLDKAMAAKTDIGESGGSKSKEFLDAQARYTASIQLFTIFSNQSSTTIKSIGESLAAISRKQ